MLYAILFLLRSICILLNGSVNFMNNVVVFYFMLCSMYNFIYFLI